MARIRDDSEKLIELYAEVGIKPGEEDKPFIIRVHPPNYSNKEILSSVPFFTYPCRFQCDVVTHFSFVLTNSSSKWTFGYCRHTPNTDRCVVVLSDLPWHSAFYKILDYCVEIDTKASGNQNLERFLNALMESDVPQPGLDLCVTFTDKDLIIRNFKTSVPDHQRLPSIPEDRNITEYFNAVCDKNMIKIFASMLAERRIVITSERLNRLSSCVQAANALIYPMHWQHIFIPLLPAHLIDYLSAPMPFLIGVPSSTLATMRPSELSEIVLLNVDTDTLTTPYDDISNIPSDVLSTLNKALSKNSSSLSDSLCRAFLRALVSLIGSYRAALKIVPGEQITFDNEKFVQSVRGTSKQLFLEKMLQLQIFQQFIESRLEMFNAQRTLDDQFEIELNHGELPSSNLFKTQYKEWTSTMKKEGGALVRAFNSKSKVAITKSRQAVRNIIKKHYIATTPAGGGGNIPASPKNSWGGKSLKKSISGSAISQTSKTVTYVRNTNGLNSSAGSLTGNSGKSKFYYSQPLESSIKNGNSFNSNRSTSGNSLAPSASPESSDVEDEKFVFPDFRNLKIKDISINQQKIQTSGQSATLLTPIPPPRGNSSSRSTLRHNGPVCTMNTEKCLIQFDSPPKEEKHKNTSNGAYNDSSSKSLLAEIDDSLASFDPLRSSSYVSLASQNSTTTSQSSANGSTSNRSSFFDLTNNNTNIPMSSNSRNNFAFNHNPSFNNENTGNVFNDNNNSTNNLQTYSPLSLSTLPPVGNTNNLLFFYEPNNNNFNVSIPRDHSSGTFLSRPQATPNISTAISDNNKRVPFKAGNNWQEFD